MDFQTEDCIKPSQIKESLACVGLEKLGKQKILEMIQRKYYNGDIKKPDYYRMKAMFEQMEKDEQWMDSWYISERPDGWIGGSTMMNNGGKKILMEKIGIDLTIIEWSSDYDTTKATNPLAIDFFIESLLVELVTNNFTVFSPIPE